MTLVVIELAWARVVLVFYLFSGVAYEQSHDCLSALALMDIA